jgi:hypothetical protein
MLFRCVAIVDERRKKGGNNPQGINQYSDESLNIESNIQPPSHITTAETVSRTEY